MVMLIKATEGIRHNVEQLTAAQMNDYFEQTLQSLDWSNVSTDIEVINGSFYWINDYSENFIL